MCNEWDTDPEQQGMRVVYSKKQAGFILKAQNYLTMVILTTRPILCCHVSNHILNVLLWGGHMLFTCQSASSRVLSHRVLLCDTSSPQGQVETSLLRCHVLLCADMCFCRFVPEPTAQVHPISSHTVPLNSLENKLNPTLHTNVLPMSSFYHTEICQSVL